MCLTSEDRIAHGILAGVKLAVKPLIVGTLSPKEVTDYFRTKQEEVDGGLELIPGKLRIRKVTKEDVGMFSGEPYRWRQDQIPLIGEVLIEGEYSHESEFLAEFNIITNTQLALCLLKTEHVFLKSLYSFSKVSNVPNEWHILLPIPIPDIFAQFGISIHPDDKEAIINLLKKINAIDFKNNSSLMIACSRFLRSYHDLYIEDKLIDLIISFEALFIRSRKGNKGHRIGKKCSELIEKYKTERKTIYNDLKRAYDIRNDIIHGSPFDKNEIGQLLPSIENYLRKSILRQIP